MPIENQREIQGFTFLWFIRIEQNKWRILRNMKEVSLSHELYVLEL